MDEEAKTLLHRLVYKPLDEDIQRLTRMRDEAYESALAFYESVLKGIDPKYHTQFIMFAEKGEAGPEFLNYIDNNERAQKACEMVLERQANAFHRLAQAMRNDCLEELANETPDVTVIRGKK